MKTTISLLFFLFFSLGSLFSQVPQALKYQAIARDASGNLIAEKELGIRINLLQGSETGNVLYSETHKVKSNEFGLVNVLIGQGKRIEGEFEEIDWGAYSCWVKVEMDFSGKDEYKLMGSTALYSVPYALYAQQAGTIRNHYTASAKDKTIRHGNRSRDLSLASTPNSKISSSGDSWLNASMGNVGIGTVVPDRLLHVAGGTVLCDYSHDGEPNFEVRNESGVYGGSAPPGGYQGIFAGVSSDDNTDKYGYIFDLGGLDGSMRGIYGSIFGGGNGNKYGLDINVMGSDGQKTGIDLYVSGENGTKYGVNASVNGNYGKKYGVKGAVIIQSIEGSHYGIYGNAQGSQENNYGIYGKAYGNYGEKFAIYGEASGSGTNWAGYFDGRLFVDQNVGFGISDPDEHLDIYGSGNQTIQISSSDQQDVAIEFIREGGVFVDWRIVDSSGHLFFLYNDDDFATHPTKGYRLHSTSPDPPGFQPIESGVKNLGGTTGYWKNLYTTGGLIFPSSPDEMADIEDLKYGLKEIMQLKPVSCRLIYPDSELRPGLIASTTEHIIPEAVVKDPVYDIISEAECRETGEIRYGMNYSVIVPVLIKGMQEQQEMIDELKLQNSTMQKRIERLEQIVLGE